MSARVPRNQPTDQTIVRYMIHRVKKHCKWHKALLFKKRQLVVTFKLVPQQVQLLQRGQVSQGVRDVALQLVLLHVERFQLAETSQLWRDRAREAVMTQAQDLGV